MILERTWEVLDGLLLGGGRLHAAPVPVVEMRAKRAYRAWVLAVAEELERVSLGGVGTVVGTRLVLRTHPSHALWELARRWAGGVPRDVRLTPLALAHWFAGCGARGSNGYSVRFAMHRFARSDVEFLIGQLRGLYGWQAEVFEDHGPLLRLSRSGDRMGFRRLVAGLLPACFAHRLLLRESAPCSPEEAARRRRPRVLDAMLVAEVRRRVEAGERYADIARDLGVNERHIGRIARGERWADPGVSIIRRRARVRRLSVDEVRTVFDLAAKGESQHAIARVTGINQPRISRLLRSPRP